MSQFEDAIPESVRHFVRIFSRSILNSSAQSNPNELLQLYTVEYNKLTERMYKTSTWPTIDTLSSTFTSRDQNILIDSSTSSITLPGLLYRELFYRHIYTRMVPELDDRFDSFQNYIDLFNHLLGLDESTPELILPTIYQYDLIHYFIQQFIEFHQYRQNTAELSAGDINTLCDSGVHLWSAQTVLRYLHAFIRKSGIDDSTADNSIIHTQFKSFGQFASIGLCRVNTVLCDYQNALISLDTIILPNDLRKKVW